MWCSSSLFLAWSSQKCYTCDRVLFDYFMTKAPLVTYKILKLTCLSVTVVNVDVLRQSDALLIQNKVGTLYLIILIRCSPFTSWERSDSTTCCATNPCCIENPIITVNAHTHSPIGAANSCKVPIFDTFGGSEDGVLNGGFIGFSDVGEKFSSKEVKV